MTQSEQDPNSTHAASAGEVTAAARATVPTPANVDPDQQLGFLYKALDDNQALIRFLDAKVAFAAAVLAAMTGQVLSNLGTYFPWSGQPVWRQLLVLAFGLAAISTAVLMGLILFPTTNPVANTNLRPATGPLFFLSHLSPRRWQRIFSRNPKYSRLGQDHSEYLTHITGADSAALIRVVSAEVLKVSYIRQIKTDRLRALVVVLASSAFLFVLLLTTNAWHPIPLKPTVVKVEGPLTVNPAPSTKLPAVKP